VSEVRLGPEDAGRTVTVAAGDRLVLELPENPGTGYTWQVEALPAGAAVREERYEQPSGAGIGGASQHVFVLDPGTGGPVRLRHGRPWLGEEGVSDRYELTVLADD
jgi:inhibitor of cysteine peptidase